MNLNSSFSKIYGNDEDTKVKIIGGKLIRYKDSSSTNSHFDENSKSNRNLKERENKEYLKKSSYENSRIKEPDIPKSNTRKVSEKHAKHIEYGNKSLQENNHSLDLHLKFSPSILPSHPITLTLEEGKEIGKRLRRELENTSLTSLKNCFLSLHRKSAEEAGGGGRKDEGTGGKEDNGVVDVRSTTVHFEQLASSLYRHKINVSLWNLRLVASLYTRGHDHLDYEAVLKHLSKHFKKAEARSADGGGSGGGDDGGGGGKDGGRSNKGNTEDADYFENNGENGGGEGRNGTRNSRGRKGDKESVMTADARGGHKSTFGNLAESYDGRRNAGTLNNPLNHGLSKSYNLITNLDYSYSDTTNKDTSNKNFNNSNKNNKFNDNSNNTSNKNNNNNSSSGDDEEEEEEKEEGGFDDDDETDTEDALRRDKTELLLNVVSKRKFDSIASLASFVGDYSNLLDLNLSQDVVTRLLNEAGSGADRSEVLVVLRKALEG